MSTIIGQIKYFSPVKNLSRRSAQIRVLYLRTHNITKYVHKVCEFHHFHFHEHDVRAHIVLLRNFRGIYI